MATTPGTTVQSAVHETDLPGLTRIHRGKVRDTYAVDERHMLLVATDRLSAFDVVLPDPIPGKGRVLNEISLYWFARTAHIVPNHLSGRSIESLISDPEQRQMLEGRAVIVKRLRALPIEAVVRGYLIGSGWKEYQATGSICGIKLPPGLRQAQALPEPIFTPATKAPAGAHDENIPFESAAQILGLPVAQAVRSAALAIYSHAARHASERGIIIADTKFEFGLDQDNTLTLIDEVLTPDSSRFWPADTWQVGISPPSFDKQFVRDYLETLDWDKRPPAPKLPPDIIERTGEKYREALQRLTSD